MVERIIIIHSNFIRWHRSASSRKKAVPFWPSGLFESSFQSIHSDRPNSKQKSYQSAFFLKPNWSPSRSIWGHYFYSHQWVYTISDSTNKELRFCVQKSCGNSIGTESGYKILDIPSCYQANDILSSGLRSNTLWSNKGLCTENSAHRFNGCNVIHSLWRLQHAPRYPISEDGNPMRILSGYMVPEITFYRPSKIFITSWEDWSQERMGICYRETMYGTQMDSKLNNWHGPW